MLTIRPTLFYSVKHTVYRTILIMTNTVIYQKVLPVSTYVHYFVFFVCPSLLAGNPFIPNSSSVSAISQSKLIDDQSSGVCFVKLNVFACTKTKDLVAFVGLSFRYSFLCFH